MDFSTIILRFRDLVTESGKTIEAHKSIINNNNNSYVWWAWWKKGREKTPVGEFATLNEIAKDQKLKIFLLDSGNNKLYYALCNEIKFSSTKLEESPEKDKTPEYYRDNLYNAWFKFEKIEECDNSKLKKYSYVDIESLFEDNEDDYSLFNDKMVFDTKELIQQNRTLWFIREFIEGDKENEIKLLNSNYIEPSNFSVKFNELTGNSFLWLSDLHLSNDVLSVTPGDKSLTNHIKISCAKSSDALFSDISALIISGDITDCCSEKGFNQAETMITNLNRELGGALDNQRIIISPGNHDFKRIETFPPKENEEYKEPDYYWEHPESSEFFSKFYKDIFRIKPNKFMANGRKYLTQSGKTVEFVALNTMILQQYKGFEGHGYISQEQLDFVEKEMNWKKASSAIRIVIMHHHYCPACLHERMSYDKAGSVVYDADRLIRWSVKNNVKLILHGHKHNEFFSKVSIPVAKENKTLSSIDVSASVLRDIYVLSLGGTGAKDTEHKFATITFDDDKLTVRIFKFYPDLISDNVLDKTITIPYEANK